MSSSAEKQNFPFRKLIFPKLKDGKLDTIEFLNTAKAIVSLLGRKNHIVLFHKTCKPHNNYVPLQSVMVICLLSSHWT
jgi:hypothetical protein